MKFFGWIDHDSAHEASVLRALGAAKGHDARDELGLGAIRDTFSDLFFPGLSTVQTRVRYFLFVQWCCELAARGRDEGQVLGALRQAEVDLIAALTPLGERQGVIGILSQDRLERMPSEIYWTGLLVLGMRRRRGSRRLWARTVAAHRVSDAPPAEDGGEGSSDTGFESLRPDPPSGFPGALGIDFRLTADEAEFLRRRLCAAHVDPEGRGHEYNLFGVFSAYRRRTAVDHPWDHPRVERLRPAARDLLAFARAFSGVMYGATILYNLQVGDLLVRDGGTTAYRDAHLGAFEGWRTSLQVADVETVLARLGDIPELAAIARHGVDAGTISFVRAWARFCRAPLTLLTDPRPARLVSERELALKEHAGTSRIRSRKVRERWNGESGGMIGYRWEVARRCLNDLAGGS